MNFFSETFHPSILVVHCHAHHKVHMNFIPLTMRECANADAFEAGKVAAEPVIMADKAE